MADLNDLDFAEMKFLAGCNDFANLLREDPYIPFSKSVLAFLNDLSRAILASENCRRFSEIIALAYWMRKSRLTQLGLDYPNKGNGGLLRPRGLVFHIAPSNVDTIFVYSLVLSMLAGNKNVIRISSNDSEQISLLIDLIDELLKTSEHAGISRTLSIVSYPRNDRITGLFSAHCDMRVIWGGDLSVKSIRALPLGPNATEICFPDKISHAVFDADFFLEQSEKNKISVVNHFINDSYVFGQLACSSPQMMVWRGAEKSCLSASGQFWALVDTELSGRNQDFSDVEFMNKRVAEQLVAAHGGAEIVATKTNQVTVVRLSNVAEFSADFRCGSGFFLEAHIGKLSSISKLANSKTQTLVSYGVERKDWEMFLENAPLPGIDRIVPPGQALEFSPVWDGMDLLREFSRETSFSIG